MQFTDLPGIEPPRSGGLGAVGRTCLIVWFGLQPPGPEEDDGGLRGRHRTASRWRGTGRTFPAASARRTRHSWHSRAPDSRSFPARPRWCSIPNWRSRSSWRRSSSMRPSMRRRATCGPTGGRSRALPSVRSSSPSSWWPSLCGCSCPTCRGRRAVALGAIVAPPDAAAAGAVLRQLRPPHRLLVILEGESLFNDASALLIYRLAVGVATVGFLPPAACSRRCLRRVRQHRPRPRPRAAVARRQCPHPGRVHGRGGAVLHRVRRLDPRRAAPPFAHHYPRGVRDGGVPPRAGDPSGAHAHPRVGGMGGGGLRAQRARVHPRGIPAQVDRGEPTPETGARYAAVAVAVCAVGDPRAHCVGGRRGGLQPLALPAARRRDAWPGGRGGPHAARRRGRWLVRHARHGHARRRARPAGRDALPRPDRRHRVCRRCSAHSCCRASRSGRCCCACGSRTTGWWSARCGWPGSRRCVQPWRRPPAAPAGCRHRRTRSPSLRTAAAQGGGGLCCKGRGRRPGRTRPQRERRGGGSRRRCGGGACGDRCAAPAPGALRADGTIGDAAFQQVQEALDWAELDWAQVVQ